MPNFNLDLDALRDLTNEMKYAIQWLDNLKTALKNEKYSELSGNIGRIEEIQKKLSALRDCLNKFTPSSEKD